jgi:hypothetical protein
VKVVRIDAQYLKVLEVFENLKVLGCKKLAEDYYFLDLLHLKKDFFLIFHWYVVLHTLMQSLMVRVIDNKELPTPISLQYQVRYG